jgi:GPH family glycoside/pentoside/hexuronide:cation symporter
MGKTTPALSKCDMWIFGLVAVTREPVTTMAGIYSLVFYE